MSDYKKSTTNGDWFMVTLPASKKYEPKGTVIYSDDNGKPGKKILEAGQKCWVMTTDGKTIRVDFVPNLDIHRNIKRS